MALLEIDHLGFRVAERPLLDCLELTVAADVLNTRPLPELRRLLAQVRR
jgi:hypothetical protein